MKYEKFYSNGELKGVIDNETNIVYELPITAGDIVYDYDIDDWDSIDDYLNRINKSETTPWFAEEPVN